MIDWLAEGSVIGFLMLCGIAVVRVAFGLFTPPMPDRTPTRRQTRRAGSIVALAIFLAWIALAKLTAGQPAPPRHPQLAPRPAHQEHRDVILTG